jgi:hypothetical protein
MSASYLRSARITWVHRNKNTHIGVQGEYAIEEFDAANNGSDFEFGGSKLGLIPTTNTRIHTSLQLA